MLTIEHPEKSRVALPRNANLYKYRHLVIKLRCLAPDTKCTTHCSGTATLIKSIL